MSATTRNSLTLFLPTAGIVCGQLVQSGSGSTITLANQSGDRLHQSDVTVTRNSAGNYTVAIRDFKGPAGRFCAAAFVNTTTVASNAVQIGATTYSNRTLSVDILTLISGSAADCGVFFEIKAF